MKYIIPADQTIVTLLGEQKLSEKNNVRESCFSISVDVDNGRLLYNTLTNECVFISENEVDTEIEDCLFKKYFLVNFEFDEFNLVDELRALYQITDEKQNKFSSYTIYTTTNCNANCFYCFQKHYKHSNMNMDIANSAISFVRRTCDKKKPISLIWMGGEPLLNYKVINQICTGLENGNVCYNSIMITNGYLFCNETIRDYIKCWNLRYVQITLDGTQNVYNKIKNIENGKTDAFSIVLKNIDFLLCNGVNVGIRLNIDSHNAQNIFELVDVLHERYKSVKNLSLYSSPLFEDVEGEHFQRTPEQRVEVLNLEKELDEKIYSLGMGDYVPNIKETQFNSCMADSNDSIMILPDGYLGKCARYSDGNYVGHVYDSNLNEDLLSKFHELRNRLDECNSCPLYPKCFRLKMCDGSEMCFVEHKIKQINEIKRAVQNEYHAFLELENNKVEE